MHCNPVVEIECTSRPIGSLRTQTVLRGVLLPCYQHHSKVPQLHATQLEPIEHYA